MHFHTSALLAGMAIFCHSRTVAWYSRSKMVEGEWTLLQITVVSSSQILYLAISATLTPSERVLIVAGNVCNHRRASLSPDNMYRLVLLTQVTNNREAL